MATLAQVLPQANEVWIVKPSSLGDVIHTLPCAALIKQTWPQIKLTWIVNREWAPLIEGSPLLERVIHFPRKDFRGPLGLWRMAQWLGRLGKGTAHPQPDVVLDFQGLLRSALIARASRGRFIAGLSDAREGARFFYHQVVPVEAQAHAIDRYLTLVEAAGAQRPSLEQILSPDHWPAGEAVDGIDAVEPFLLLHPFSRGEGKSLNWQEVMILIEEAAPRRIIIAGMGPESPSPLPSHATNLCGKTTLRQLLGLLRRAQAVISVDSGPMHLAAALRRPLIGIHTWSDPRKVGPYSPESLIWKGGQLLRRHEITNELAYSSQRPDPSDLRQIIQAIPSA